MDDHDVRGGYDCRDHQWIYVPERRTNICGICHEPARALLSFLPYSDRCPPEWQHRTQGSCEELYDSIEAAQARLDALRKERRIERAAIYTPATGAPLGRVLYSEWTDEPLD